MGVRDTRWSLVLRAGAGSLSALDELIGAYWFAVYASLRKRGLSPEDAAESCQEFFAGLLRRNDLSRVKRDGRRFRSWLYAALGHHVANERKAANALRRQRIEVDDAEERFTREVAPGLDPEQTYARQWALAVLSTATDRVAERYAARGKSALFEALEPALRGQLGPHAEIAAALGMKPGAVKVAVHRLKQRFGEALRDEVAETLDGPEDIDTELRSLLAALGGR